MPTQFDPTNAPKGAHAVPCKCGCGDCDFRPSLSLACNTAREGAACLPDARPDRTNVIFKKDIPMTNFEANAGLTDIELSNKVYSESGIDGEATPNAIKWLRAAAPTSLKCPIWLKDGALVCIPHARKPEFGTISELAVYRDHITFRLAGVTRTATQFHFDRRDLVEATVVPWTIAQALVHIDDRVVPRKCDEDFAARDLRIECVHVCKASIKYSISSYAHLVSSAELSAEWILDDGGPCGTYAIVCNNRQTISDYEHEKL